MKRIALISSLLLLFAVNGFSQVQHVNYIELRGTVDALGNITIMTLPEKNNSPDTAVNLKSINKLITRGKNAIEVINLLSSEGWTLVSALSIHKDDSGRPNTPFLVYYFKKNSDH